MVGYGFLSQYHIYADRRSEAAVVLDLHSRDAPTRHLVATFPTVVFSGNTTDRDGQIDASDVQAPTGPPPISGPMSPSEAPGGLR